MSGTRPPACPGVSWASGGGGHAGNLRRTESAVALQSPGARGRPGGVSRGPARPGDPEQAAAFHGRRHVSQLGLPVFKPSQDGGGTQGQLSF